MKCDSRIIAMSKATEMVEEFGVSCPECYITKYDDNNNVINATKIVLEKKKKEYPKTYEECCEIIHSDPKFYVDTHLYSGILEALYKVLICRNAYWKIAGEEMGLGKPWEPVYQDDKQDKHCIYVDIWGVTLHQDNIVQHVLSFPTEEMRDAFYENFKKEIEFCKELL